jgi:hypothetical protein
MFLRCFPPTWKSRRAIAGRWCYAATHPDAAALMRMALAYAVSDLSMKDIAGGAHGLGLTGITGPGLFYRLRESEAWLERVLAQTLQKEGSKGSLRGKFMRAGWDDGYIYRLTNGAILKCDCPGRWALQQRCPAKSTGHRQVVRGAG